MMPRHRPGNNNIYLYYWGVMYFDNVTASPLPTEKKMSTKNPECFRFYSVCSNLEKSSEIQKIYLLGGVWNPPPLWFEFKHPTSYNIQFCYLK